MFILGCGRGQSKQLQAIASLQRSNSSLLPHCHYNSGTLNSQNRQCLSVSYTSASPSSILNNTSLSPSHSSLRPTFPSDVCRFSAVVHQSRSFSGCNNANSDSKDSIMWRLRKGKDSFLGTLRSGGRGLFSTKGSASSYIGSGFGGGNAVRNDSISNSSLPLYYPLSSMTTVDQVLKRKASMLKSENGGNSESLFHCDETETVLDAIKKMAKANIGSVLVTKNNFSGNKVVVGIFTERDYLKKIAVVGVDSAKTPLHSVMTENLTCVTQDCSLDKCLDILAQGNFRHLPVLAPNPPKGDNLLANYVGLVSVKDIITKLGIVLSRTSHRAYLDEAMLTGSVTVGNLIHNGVAAITVQPDQTVFEAIKKMAAANQGAVLVVNNCSGENQQELMGIMTERDYLSKVRLEGRFSKDVMVSEIMIPQERIIKACHRNTVSECIDLLTQHGIRHLPIVRAIESGKEEKKNSSAIALLSVENVLKIAV
eukprot:Nk52_evm44s158 gene=Nk52_evmTU44s158